MQKTVSFYIFVAILSVFLTLSIIACAATRGGTREEMGKMLTAAGFKKGIADTPDRLTALKKLPQRQVVPHEEGNKLVYIYVDVKNCECAYVGDEEAYQKYRKLSHAKQIAEDDRREAVRNKQIQMDSDDTSFGRDW